MAGKRGKKGLWARGKSLSSARPSKAGVTTAGAWNVAYADFVTGDDGVLPAHCGLLNATTEDQRKASPTISARAI